MDHNCGLLGRPTEGLRYDPPSNDTSTMGRKWGGPGAKATRGGTLSSAAMAPMVMNPRTGSRLIGAVVSARALEMSSSDEAPPVSEAMHDIRLRVFDAAKTASCL